MYLNTIYHGDVLEVLKTFPDECVNCVVTSPPYWGLRDYGVDGQLGLESTPDEYVEKMVRIFREIKRVLKDDGTIWVNLGDSYSGSGKGGQSKEKRSENWQPEYVNKGIVPNGTKLKDLCGIPWRVAFALQSDGWYLRCDIIWDKKTHMPESVTDRPTKSHEYIFLMSKSRKYYYDQDSTMVPTITNDDVIRDRDTTKLNNTPGRRKMGGLKNNNYDRKNIRSVWHIPTQPFPKAHFATFPEKLIEPCIKAGCPVGGVVLDPFMGSGTAAVVSHKLDRNWVGIELNQEYIDMANSRIERETKQHKLDFGGIGDETHSTPSGRKALCGKQRTIRIRKN